MIQRALRAIFFVALMAASASSHALVSCTASASGIMFGAYNPFSSAPLDSTGNIGVTCSGILSSIAIYTVSLSTGHGSYADRSMVSGAHKLSYNIYRDSARLLKLGDGSLGTVTIGDSLTLYISPLVKNHVIYGRISPLQTTVPVGTYTDSIVVTVSF